MTEKQRVEKIKAALAKMPASKIEEIQNYLDGIIDKKNNEK